MYSMMSPFFGKQLEYLPLPMDAKAVSEEGEFEGYLTRWDETDLEGDVVKRGAFRETLKSSPFSTVPGQRPLLWQHFPFEPIGVIKGKEDSEGLFVNGQINLEVQRGKEAYSLLKQGAINGLSQGYDPVDWKALPNGQGREMKRLEWWEGSMVTFPALPSARIGTVAHARMPGAQDEESAVASKLASWLEQRGLFKPETRRLGDGPTRPDVDYTALGEKLKTRLLN